MKTIVEDSYFSHLESKELLLKPVSVERLQKAIYKMEPLPSVSEKTKEVLEMASQVFLQDGDSCYWVAVQDIHYLVSCGNYTNAYWKDNKATVPRSLGKIEKRLPAQYFFRANRQNMVNVKEVANVQPWINGGFQLRLKSGVIIDVSRRYSGHFKECFSL